VHPSNASSSFDNFFESMTSRAAAEQIGTGVPKMDALGAKVKHCRMLDDTSMQERGHETQDADPESKAQHNNGAIEPKDAGTEVLVSKRCKRRHAQRDTDLGALWRLQRSDTKYAQSDAGFSRPKLGSAEQPFLGRNVRKRSARPPRPQGHSVPKQQHHVASRRLQHSHGTSKEVAGVMGPLEDANDECSSQHGEGGLSSFLGALTERTEHSTVLRPPSPEAGPFQLQSVFRRMGSAAVPLIVDEERSIKGLRSSGDSDQLSDLIAPPPLTLFKF